MSDTARAAGFVLRLRADAIPPATAEVARVAILDGLACAIAGRDEPVAARVREWARAQGGREAATLWGSGQRVPAPLAALANGAAAHALDFDDVSWAMNGHPTVPLLPAALAAAEVAGASGMDLLRAFVAGFEVEARIGQMLGRPHYEKGWHATSTAGVFGATAACAFLLGLNAGELRRAFGIAASRAAGTRANFGTDTKPLHAGLAARAGLEAAELAKLGVTAREDILETEMGLADLYGAKRPAALPPLGAPFALERPGLELKPYPSCRFTHRAIDLVLALREKHGERALRAIEVAGDPLGQKILIYATPRTGLEAKFSLQYCAAVAWLDGWPGLGSFSDARAAREDVQSLLRRVAVREARGAEEEVELVFADGARERATARLAKGNPEVPLTEAERLAKVRACVGPVLGSAKAERLIDTVARLESLGSASELTGCLA
ncbi:MAG TPA: MmgE/PrpD family protein [Myxococcota bacterium]|nr:MmgE/PrpD family protein [Myxococcota bacterium]